MADGPLTVAAMRWALSGILVLLLASSTLAQAEGVVESVGFGGYYRPNTWTAVKVSIKPTSAENQSVKLMVAQDDLDGDHVTYSELIPLTGNTMDGAKVQKFWTYFIPQPSGLDGNSAEFAKRFRVCLATPAGKVFKELDPTGLKVSVLESGRGSGGELSTKLILVVRATGSTPHLLAYQGGGGPARGVLEQIHFEPVSVGDLPDRAIGYQSVDAILWLNADPTPPQLSADALTALQNYVRGGGRLVVCHPREKWQEVGSGLFGAMLPVQAESAEMVDAKTGLGVLRQIADPGDVRPIRPLGGLSPWRHLPPAGATSRDPWQALRSNEFPFVRAKVREGAVQELTAEVRGQRLPWLVRWPYGSGSVTWVAQDLGDPAFMVHSMGTSYGRGDESGRAAELGWTEIWDRVFDWRHATSTGDTDALLKGLGEDDRGGMGGTVVDPEFGGGAVNLQLEPPLLAGTELKSRGAALIGVAVLFFIVYWVVAGPVSFVSLARRKLAQWSWVAFGVCAVAATALTGLIVKLVLAGSPQLQHVSFVRVEPDGEATVQSSIGLYIPRDGSQDIALRDCGVGRESYLTPLPLHPDFYQAASDLLPRLPYEAPVPSALREGEAMPALSVPYRRTLKKFEAQWHGRMKGRISGTAQLGTADNIPFGALTNSMGVDLHDVYLIFRVDAGDKARDSRDMVLYMPDYQRKDGRVAAWVAGEKIDLRDYFTQATLLSGRDTQGKKETNGRLRGWLTMTEGWAHYRWYPYSFSGDFMNEMRADSMDRAALLLGLFNRLPPSRHMKQEQGTSNRFELLRRQGRLADVSAAISAGQMVALARSGPDQPLPMGLEVEGDVVAGKGQVYYQLIVPMQRARADEAAAQTQPQTQPSR